MEQGCLRMSDGREDLAAALSASIVAGDGGGLGSRGKGKRLTPWVSRRRWMVALWFLCSGDRGKLRGLNCLARSAFASHAEPDSALHNFSCAGEVPHLIPHKKTE